MSISEPSNEAQKSFVVFLAKQFISVPHIDNTIIKEWRFCKVEKRMLCISLFYLAHFSGKF